MADWYLDGFTDEIKPVALSAMENREITGFIARGTVPTIVQATDGGKMLVSTTTARTRTAT
jgi:hypothetical protein